MQALSMFLSTYMALILAYLFLNLGKSSEERFKKNKQGGREDDDAKMDEHTHFIQDIVYARDPKIFDTKNGLVN